VEALLQAGADVSARTISPYLVPCFYFAPLHKCCFVAKSDKAGGSIAALPFLGPQALTTLLENGPNS
jgi:hypothetical protein